MLLEGIESATPAVKRLEIWFRPHGHRDLCCIIVFNINVIIYLQEWSYSEACLKRNLFIKETWIPQQTFSVPKTRSTQVSLCCNFRRKFRITCLAVLCATCRTFTKQTASSTVCQGDGVVPKLEFITFHTGQTLSAVNFVVSNYR
jgi:hypothetical protein